jgi:peroxiredoxin
MHVPVNWIRYRRWVSCWALCSLFVAGCSQEPTLPGDVGPTLEFLDDAPANTQLTPESVRKIILRNVDGTETSIDKLHEGRNLVLVITRGVVGSEIPNKRGEYGKGLCAYCSTQVSRLIANYDKFRKRNAEVVVVFPVARSKDQGEIEVFAARVQGESKTTKDAPFPILLDMELQAVDALGIREDLSKPATYIIDSSGQVRYAYVGRNLSDRPSVKAMLAQLDAIPRKS